MFDGVLSTIASTLWQQFVRPFWWFWLGCLVLALLPDAVRAIRRRSQDRRALARGVASVDYMKRMSGEEFERFCGEYFSQQGYAVRYTPRGFDHGIDLILTKDDEQTLVQCKRHTKPVGEPVVRDLYSAVLDRGANAGIVCASEGFTKPAINWVRGKPITLLTGEQMRIRLLRPRPALSSAN